MISLALKSTVTVPVEAEMITPQAFQGKRVAEIEALPVLHGNAMARLGDFFQVSGDADDALRLAGDCSRVKYVGKGMTDGRIEIDGDAGMHLGAEMRGGEITCTRRRRRLGRRRDARRPHRASRGTPATCSGRPTAGVPRGCAAARSWSEGAAGNEVGLRHAARPDRVGAQPGTSPGS